MEPLLMVKSAVFGTGIPGRLEAYEDGVEVRTVRGRSVDTQKVLYDQIAQVGLKRETIALVMPYSELRIETRGGDVLVVQGLKHRDAERAASFVRDRAARASAGRP
jgi:hypothetical protein